MGSFDEVRNENVKKKKKEGMKSVVYSSLSMLSIIGAIWNINIYTNIVFLILFILFQILCNRAFKKYDTLSQVIIVNDEYRSIKNSINYCEYVEDILSDVEKSQKNILRRLKEVN